MDSFDYVILGGGTAGCILANRLSADPRRSVLVLESGGWGDDKWVRIPAGFSKLLTGSRFNWRFQTEPEENTHNRTIVVPRGKGLGGSTLINGMIYVRGQPADFDTWAQMGATGWSFDDVLPYFKKMEHYAGAADPALRGRDGPMHVVEVSECHPLADAFIAAGVQAGYPRNPDYNGRDQLGFGYYQATQKSGQRWSAADAYLRPARGRPNLTIQTGAHITGLLMDGARVTGARYRLGDALRDVGARADVILAAGAVQSPHLLELSGIGDPAVLAAAGIALQHALPGVRRNYQDHYCTRMNWRVKRPITLNEASRGWRLGREIAKYYISRSGILTLGTGLAFGFVKTRPELATPDVQYFFMHASYANAADRSLDRAPGMTVGVTQLRPHSRGAIHAVSPDPMRPPAIRPNFLADRVDQGVMADGMRLARRIIAQPAMDPYRAQELTPGEAVSTDAAWVDFARHNGQTIYHPIGTCSMGGGTLAVVDARLRVHGVAGLRVADASIMPAMVSGNTQAAVMMVAEKAADMIIADARAFA